MATSIDFSQGINFYPLEKLGVSRTEAIKLLAGMAGLINLELKAKIKRVFSRKELNVINLEAAEKRIKPEDGLEFLESKYYVKTGVYFMEELRRLYNRYLADLARLLLQARSDAAKVKAAEQSKQAELNRLVKAKDWPGAVKLLEEVLKTKP